MIIQELKNRIDIIDIIGKFTMLKGYGNRLRAAPGQNPIREDGSGDFDVYQDTQRFYDHGTGESGDVIDFIEKAMDFTKAEALSFLQEKYLGGADIDAKPRPLPRMRNKPIKKDSESLLHNLEIKANKYLSAHPMRMINGKGYRLKKWGYTPVEIEEFEGQTRVENVIWVHQVFEKLFEDYIVPTDPKFAKYLFDKVVGYCEYFNCPAIILRDESETVINIIQYRPERNGEPLTQGDKPLKYLNLRSEEVPDSDYIFPLQAQMQKMATKEGYCYVGEGLKNAINASLMGIPFISIEGAASIKPGLINFLRSDRMNSITLIGAFDGDEAGERAYKKMNTEISMTNEFSFDSGIDFADFLKGWR